MTPIIIKSSFWPLYFAGQCLWPFIIIRKKYVKEDGNIPVRLLRHEVIHFWEAKKWLVFPWYIAYMLHFGWNFLKLFKVGDSYRTVWAEKLAYGEADNPDFLPKYLEDFVKANS